MDPSSRFDGIWIVFAIYVAVGVQGADYGAACTGTGAGDCTETTNIVCDTNCKCTATSFRKSTPECAPKILLKAACTASQPADQCADALAACASGNICLCKPGHFENKDGKCAKQVAIKTNCGVAETASDQCVATTECKDDGKGIKKCLCKATHYETGQTCTPRIVPGASCAADQCVTHASCNKTSTKCQCETGYTATPSVTPTMCSGVIKVATLWYMMVVPIYVSMMSLLR